MEVQRVEELGVVTRNLRVKTVLNVPSPDSDLDVLPLTLGTRWVTRVKRYGARSVGGVLAPLGPDH